MVRYHFIVRGIVQGVGFRHFTLTTARRFGIAGWVLNRYDGTVEIDAEGSEEAMALFTKQIKSGHPYSRVDTVEIIEMEQLRHYQGFDIRF